MDIFININERWMMFYDRQKIEVIKPTFGLPQTPQFLQFLP